MSHTFQNDEIVKYKYYIKPMSIFSYNDYVNYKIENQN